MNELPRGLVGWCEARVGATLCDKWRLDGLIDVGGMAAVYSAVHRNGNRVAIKMLHPDAALVPGVRERFLKEGYVANHVGHAGTPCDHCRATVNQRIVDFAGLFIAWLAGSKQLAPQRRAELLQSRFRKHKPSPPCSIGYWRTAFKVKAHRPKTARHGSAKSPPGASFRLCGLDLSVLRHCVGVERNQKTT